MQVAAFFSVLMCLSVGIINQVVMAQYEEGGTAWSVFMGPNGTGESSFHGPTSPSVYWKATIKVGLLGDVRSSPTMSKDGMIYAGSEDNLLYALTPTGSIAWTFAATDSIRSATAIREDGSLLFGSLDNNIYCVNSVGSLLWNYTTGNSIEGSIVVGKDGTVYAGSDDNYLYAFYSDGSLKWKFLTNSHVECTPSIGKDGNIYFSSYDSYVYAITPTASLIWKTLTKNSIFATVTFSRDQSVLYVGSVDNSMYCLNRTTGSIVWTFLTQGTIYATAAIDAHDNIIFGNYGSVIYSLTPSGSLNWHYSVGSRVFGSATIDPVGNIYIGSRDSTMYCFTSSGSLLWSFVADQPIWATPLLGPNNTMYFGADGYYFFAVRNGVQAPVSLSPVADSNTNSNSINKGALIGIIVGVVVFFVVLLAVLVYCYHNTKELEMKANSLEDSNGVELEDNPMDRSSNRYFSKRMDINTSSYVPKMIESLGIDVRGVPFVDWTVMSLMGSGESAADAIIGKGSFGIVAKALWVIQSGESSKSMSSSTKSASQGKGLGFSSDSNSAKATETTAITATPVAIKILTKSVSGPGSNSDAYEKAVKAALEEVCLIKAAEEQIVFKECIVKVLGIVSGHLTVALSQPLNVRSGTEAIGIVMRLESGGSLRQLIYRKDKSKPFLMVEKLRLLKCIARGIAELHAANIVHADIKPDNVLLSSDNPPEIRLADFGLSMIRGEASMNLSTLAETKNVRGTPIYCAPEILHNPFADYNVNALSGDNVAKPSRKTDMYAFALMAWEVLTEQRPFQVAANEIMLSSMVHQGQRPSLDLLPKETPKKVVKLIEACWDLDRSKRKTAVECFSVLQYQHGLLSKNAYDVFLSSDVSNYLMTNLVFHRLTQLGLKVWCKDVASNTVEASSPVSASEMLQSSEQDFLSRCKVLVCVVNQLYQRNPDTMRDLTKARASHPPPPIIPVFTETDYFSWSNEELSYLCQLRSTTLVSYDISSVATETARMDWQTEDDMSEEMQNKLNAVVDKLSLGIKDTINKL